MTFLFAAVILSKTSSGLAHMWITGLERHCSIPPAPSLWKTLRFNLPPSLRFSRLLRAHQPAALHELLFTLWRSHLVFHGEMEQTGDKMSTTRLLFREHTMRRTYVRLPACVCSRECADVQSSSTKSEAGPLTGCILNTVKARGKAT